MKGSPLDNAWHKLATTFPADPQSTMRAFDELDTHLIDETLRTEREALRNFTSWVDNINLEGVDKDIVRRFHDTRDKVSLALAEGKFS